VAKTQTPGNAGVKMKSKFKGTCQVCRKTISVGESIWWNKETKKVRHDGCYKKIKVASADPSRLDLWYGTALSRPFVGSYKNGRKG
jgi:hypothetical protein